jgi:hypothetical protein
MIKPQLAQETFKDGADGRALYMEYNDQRRVARRLGIIIGSSQGNQTHAKNHDRILYRQKFSPATLLA